MKLKVNNITITEKHARKPHKLLIKQWANQINRKLEYLNINASKNATYQNLGDEDKEVTSKKDTVFNAYERKEGGLRMSDLWALVADSPTSITLVLPY